MRILCPIFDLLEQQIVAHRHPNLSHDSILAGPEERFDLQVLLDPFEKQLNLPSGLIDCRYRRNSEFMLLMRNVRCFLVSSL